MIKEFKRMIAKNPDEIFDLKPELWKSAGIKNSTDLMKYCNGKKINSTIEGIFKITN